MITYEETKEWIRISKKVIEHIPENNIVHSVLTKMCYHLERQLEDPEYAKKLADENTTTIVQ